MGRPSGYNPELAKRILSLLLDKGSLAAVCEEPGMPTSRTVFSWLRDYPEFLRDYERAREDQGDMDADHISDIARKVLAGGLDPQAARVAIDAYKWSAGKRNAKRFGDKVEVKGVLSLEGLVTASLPKSQDAQDADGS